MSGITFLKTKELEKVTDFYVNEIGMEIWLSQKNINILKHGNMIIGFHQTGDDPDEFGLITFFYETKEQVEEMYEKFQDRVIRKLQVTEAYNIYNFFAKDPEGRKLEFQAFLHPVEPYLDGKEALITRRSIRKFKQKDVSNKVLWKLFEMCRYSPTSMNSQSYYFVVTRDKEKIKFLSTLRGGSTKFMENAPMVVAIVADPNKTKRPEQDGDIAAYHFCIAALLMQLGTCWIAAMNRDDAKECLGIPQDHVVATITALGWPDEVKNVPKRREAKEFVRFI